MTRMYWSCPSLLNMRVMAWSRLGHVSVTSLALWEAADTRPSAGRVPASPVRGAAAAAQEGLTRTGAKGACGSGASGPTAAPARCAGQRRAADAGGAGGRGTVQTRRLAAGLSKLGAISGGRGTVPDCRPAVGSSQLMDVSKRHASQRPASGRPITQASGRPIKTYQSLG